MSDEKKKNIFERAVDAISSRDEKAATESANKEAEAAKAAMEQAKFDAARAKAEADRVKAEAEAAKKEAENLRAQMTNMQMKAEADDRQAEIEAQRRRAVEAAEAAEKAQAAAEAAKVIKHVWTKEDTYAGLAQKHYGSFQEPYWRLIYEHNKEIIGSHPNAIRVGLEIEIPPLPDELKKK